MKRIRWSQVRVLPGPPSKPSTSAIFSPIKQMLGDGYRFRYGVVPSGRVRRVTGKVDEDNTRTRRIGTMDLPRIRGQLMALRTPSRLPPNNASGRAPRRQSSPRAVSGALCKYRFKLRAQRLLQRLLARLRHPTHIHCLQPLPLGIMERQRPASWEPEDPSARFASFIGTITPSSDTASPPTTA